MSAPSRQLRDDVLGPCRLEPLLGAQIGTAPLGLPLLELRQVGLQLVQLLGRQRLGLLAVVIDEPFHMARLDLVPVHPRGAIQIVEPIQQVARLAHS